MMMMMMMMMKYRVGAVTLEDRRVRAWNSPVMMA
jgi:hypothetical protein